MKENTILIIFMILTIFPSGAVFATHLDKVWL